MSTKLLPQKTPTDRTRKGRADSLSTNLPRSIEVGATRIDVVELGFTAARDRMAAMFSAAREHGTKFCIVNERSPDAKDIVLMTTDELAKLVDVVPHKRPRTGAEILASLPFVGAGLPVVRSKAPDSDTRILYVPSLGRDVGA